MHIQVQEASRTPNRLHQNRTTPPLHIIIKTTSTENTERILKAVREKTQITYKDKPIKITADFPTETLKARRAWREVFKALNENSFNHRIPANTLEIFLAYFVMYTFLCKLYKETYKRA
jgi:hypothetical protein